MMTEEEKQIGLYMMKTILEVKKNEVRELESIINNLEKDMN
ncbi:unnamed protein product [marine sediment metagenome]|uniref:Uncharacterized protein n=1 Tax=marine sediment metagenome TaxID=412755 RepID=X1JJK2_9ZZZZ